MTLYVATSNAGKLAEFAASASSAGIEVLPLPGLAAMPEPVEDADSFFGNAELKALAYARLSGLPVLADDSGLEVAALGGAPGVRSARYADDAQYLHDSGLTRDQRNNRLLLERLDNAPDRSARFVCALAVAHQGQIAYRGEGVCEGEILRTAQGSGGFGYDPLFLLPAQSLSMAELTPAQKWASSHRGNAFRRLLEQLRGASL